MRVGFVPLPQLTRRDALPKYRPAGIDKNVEHLL